MRNSAWNELHKIYEKEDWIDKPNIFATEAIRYFPEGAKILELGAGQGQDTRFFANNGFEVVSTDISDEAISLSKGKLSNEIQDKVTFHQLDISELLPFEDESFDVVYAHLSLHYFDSKVTKQIINEIYRVLKPEGLVAVFTNSTSDPEYGQGDEIEEDYFFVDGKSKRYFSIRSLKSYLIDFDPYLIDNFGETYKDAAKGVHNLVRFVGRKIEKGSAYRTAIPFAGAIIEREVGGEVEILMQTRWKPNRDPVYSGTLEFAAGVLDHIYENVYDTLAREISEETGLVLDYVIDDSQTKIYKPQGNDASIGFRPFCCVQQLENGKPWIGFIFRCRVKDGEPKAQQEEVRDIKWMKTSEIKALFENTPEKLFTLEIAAWEYYFNL